MARRDSSPARGSECRVGLVESVTRWCFQRIMRIGIASSLALGWFSASTNVAQADRSTHVALQVSQMALGQNAATSSNRNSVINRFVRRSSGTENSTSSRLLPPLFGRKNQSDDSSANSPSDPLQLDQQQQLSDLMDPTRLRAKDYLENGRTSLAQGNVSGAIAWYQKAVAEDAQFAANDYTPDKLRDELEAAGVQNLDEASDKLQPPSIQPPSIGIADFPTLINIDPLDGSESNARAPAPRPGRQMVPNQFSPTVPRDPGFGAQLGAAAGLPPSGQIDFQTGRDSLTSPAQIRNDSSSHQILLQARLALSAGHVDRANDLVHQAKRSGVVSPLQLDTPQRVAELIRRHRHVQTAISKLEPAEIRYQQARMYMEQAEGLLDYGDFNIAMQLAEQADAQQAAFNGQEPSPTQLIRRIRRAVATNGQSEQTNQPAEAPAPTLFGSGSMEKPSTLGAELAIGGRSGVIAAGAAAIAQPRPKKVAQAIYDPTTDPTRNELATVVGAEEIAGPEDEAVDEIIQQGEQALADNQLDVARTYFLQALGHADAPNPAQKQQLEDRLQMVSARAVFPADTGEPSTLPGVEARQSLAWREWVNEVAYQQRKAQRLGQHDPIAALDKLKGLRDRVNQSELSRNHRQKLTARVDISIGRLEKYIEENKAVIDLDKQNRSVEDEIERERQHKLDSQQKLAELVEEFNQLRDEERFSEAELIARQARQIDPDSPVTEMMLWNAKLVKSYNRSIRINERSQEGFMDVMGNVGDAAIPFDDSSPFQFGKNWPALRNRRKGFEQQKRYSEAELEIQRRLSTPVEVRFHNRPLQEVMDTLSQLAGVNIFLDPRGLGAEAITTNEPINVNLTGKPVSLRSALNLILEPLGLDFVIQNEVLKITSEQVRDSDLFQRTYYVADLVTPIPNFNPSYNIGLPAAMKAAHDIVGYGGQRNGLPVSFASADTASPSAQTNPTLLTQMMGGGPGMPIPGQSGSVRGPMGIGPGATGGAAQADFESLIELITTTVAPDSWDEVGGPGAIKEFEGNLSLVVSQTQEVHDQIADLLDQLRRLQDLQVTIEVRFITLSDDFFERIGIDFDFDIEDNTGRGFADAATALGSDAGPSFTVGLDPVTGLPTADLDLAFSQGSFNTAIPAFGGFDPMSAANFGFAILSDIEAFFIIEAAQGDTRTNVMQSPKVTLFNGQQASVVDVSQQPFVTSIIPVVGEFAAAHQPVITVLNSGTTLSVQAVVSPDRRFVRLTLVPFFSQIGAVRTFTFNGRTSSNFGSAAVDPSDENQTVQNEVQTITEGTTVQLPEFVFTTVTTTVSVPDGGTVLLGGIKRLREGRTEAGVPMLSKLPYINRLFSNVGVGREAQSLMLMVTPRIIIQEEEEELLLGTNP